MASSNLPTIGFDRFIKLSWADYALDSALTENETGHLKKWLSSRIEGEVSARKTFNLLNNIWLKTFRETEQIRKKALLFANEIPQDDRIVLHWGMALANFELFQRTVSTIGKLIRLQGECNGKEIRKRIAESYSNQGTIPRAVSRIIQSLGEWNVIKEQDKSTYTINNIRTISNEDLIIWLLKSALNRRKDRPISLLEVFRLPELFPFELVENGQKLVRESPEFTIIREGLNQEYLVIIPS
jgi:hypothetical protein